MKSKKKKAGQWEPPPMDGHDLYMSVTQDVMKCRHLFWESIGRHDITIGWSREDQAFLASAPALRGCISHGDTRGEALHNLELMIEDWLVSASQEGWAIPAEP